MPANQLSVPSTMILALQDDTSRHDAGRSLYGRSKARLPTGLASWPTRQGTCPIMAITARADGWLLPTNWPAWPAYSSSRPDTSGGYRVDGPLYGIAVPRLGRCESHVRRPPVEQVSRIGMDASKHIFQLHSADAAERPTLRTKLRHRETIAFFEHFCTSRCKKIAAVKIKLLAWHRADEGSRRLAQIPGGADRGDVADHGDASARVVPVGSAVRCLDRADAQGPLDSGQGAAGRDHAGGRRGAPQRARGRRHGPHQARARGALPWRHRVRGLDPGPPPAQAAEAGRGGAGQQARPHRLEADGHGRGLRRDAVARHRGGHVEISPGTKHDRPASVSS